MHIATESKSAPTGVKLRLGSTLKEGEDVFLLTRDISSYRLLEQLVTVRKGKLISPNHNLLMYNRVNPFSITIIPYAGSSGGPIVDNEGSVIGLLHSQIIPEEKQKLPTQSRSDYVGSYAAKIDYGIDLMAAERVDLLKCSGKE